MNHPTKFFLLAGVLLSIANTAFCQTAEDYIKSGQQKERSGDLDGALAAFNQVLIIDANKDKSGDTDAPGDDAIAEIARDMLQLVKGDLADALADYRKDRVPDYIGFGQASCFIWVIQTKQGEKQAADQELSNTLVSTASGFMNITNDIEIANFLLGRMSEADLVTGLMAVDANGTNHQALGMGYYFIGEKHLEDGDRAGAANDFRKILSMRGTELDSRILAQAELKALGESTVPSVAVQTLSGSWSGTVIQDAPHESYIATMNLSGTNGTIEYPSLGCGGTLGLIRSDGTNFWYREHITHGNCIDGGTIQASVSAGSMTWNWTGGGVTVTGTLVPTH